MRRVALILVTLAWWSLVFVTSGESASGSWTEELLRRWFGLSGNALEVTNFAVRKFAHVFYYALLALLIAVTLYGWKSSTRLRVAIWAACLAFLTGVYDEIRQARTFNRTGTPLDLIYDLAGIGLALWAFLSLTRGK